MRVAMAFSFVFHLCVVSAMWVTLPSLFKAEPLKSQPIIVEMVSMGEETMAPVSSDNPDKEDKTSKKIPISKPLQPRSENERDVSSRVPPVTEVKPPVVTPSSKASPQSESLPSVKPALPKESDKESESTERKAPPVPARPLVKPASPTKKPKFNTEKIALLIDKSRKKESQPDTNKEVLDKKPNFLKRPATASKPVRRAKIGPRLSMRDIDAIRHQIERNWTPPAGARDAFDLVIRVRIGLNPDGSLRGAPEIVDTARMKDPFYRAAADSALRAVYKSEPLQNLPKSKYNAWRDITLTFNPRELLGG